MNASIRVKGRRLGEFHIAVKNDDVKITPLDEQEDLESAEHAGNLTADIRDAFSDERTSPSPSELHLNIFKEVLRKRGEASLTKTPSASEDSVAKMNRDNAKEPVEKKAEMKRQQEMMAEVQPGPDDADNKKGTTQADPLLNTNQNKVTSIDQNIKKQQKEGDPLLK